MRTILLALTAILALCCSEASASYESYVQANRTEKSEEAFVLVMLEDPSADPEKPDSAMANFVLKRGETKAEVFRNRHHPDKTYTFTASRDDERILRIEIVVKRDGEVVFQSTQRFASWVGF
jgi:hypothetical protein